MNKSINTQDIIRSCNLIKRITNKDPVDCVNYNLLNYTYSQYFLHVSDAQFSYDLNGAFSLGTHKEHYVGMEDLAVRYKVK